MSVIHILLMLLAAVLVAATSAAGDSLRRRSRDLPLMGYIIGSALIVGNSACLLDTAPTWYRVSMMAISVAGFAWFLVSAASATPTRTDADLASQQIYSGIVPTRPRPQLRVVRATVVGEPDEADEPAAPRQSATQATFDAYAPAGSRRASGPSYVAAHIEDYVDTSRTRRAHGRHVARTHDRRDPTERFLRLAEAYSVERGPRSLGRGAQG